ncbi:MAG: 5-formyltetrahydrofolate cyclo-ligase [Bacteroidaceae bacterium]|nr:5-formyltetrahydrofolate cyclo-ligase [Bacteroidaceae bacterium]
MTKQEIRKQLAIKFKELSETDVLLKESKSVIDNLTSDELWINAHRVLIYSSLWDEVDTSWLLRQYIHEKSIVLPTVVGDSLELHEYVSQNTTVVGAYGITESTGPIVTDYDSIDLAIIPGRAFTPDGCRLGRGKGYYDRLLPLLHCPTIGICFSFQILENIPIDTHDIKVDKVISCTKM